MKMFHLGKPAFVPVMPDGVILAERQETPAVTTESILIRKITKLHLAMAADSLRCLLRKANFNPDQPRVPAGEPGGGRWTDGGPS